MATVGVKGLGLILQHDMNLSDTAKLLEWNHWTRYSAHACQRCCWWWRRWLMS